MAASVNSSSWSTPEVYKHHEQQKICISRPKYREGRRPKAVKVYTINLESRFLLIQGVPAIGVMTELVQLCALYGVVEEYRPLDEYPAEEFTEVYLIKFQKLTSARAAKRNMDEKSFFGGLLHVCYAPEHESVEDTRQKLQDRRRYVSRIAQIKAREREQIEEESKPTTPSHTPAASQNIPTHQQGPSCGPHQGERSTSSRYCGFPLLPLPPREETCSRNTPPWLAAGPQGAQPWTVPTQLAQPRTVPTEDRMGTLHDAIDAQQHPQPPPSSPSSSSGVSCRETNIRRPMVDPRPAIRFVPRTTQLENRKRKVDDHGEGKLFGIVGKEDIIIGPKLPEPPKMDMEDKSLNKTVDLIRSTMKKVSSVPELKPTDKKTKLKPRRRI